MNDTENTFTDGRLDQILTGLDPAVTSPGLVTGSDAKAQAVLRRVLSGAEDQTSVTTAVPPQPRRLLTAARRAAVFGAVAATITAGFVVGPSLFRGGQALAWSATPQALSTSAAHQAETACVKAVLDDPAPVEGADRSRMRPVITEARGSLVLVYLTDRAPSPSESTCYVRDGSVVGMGGSLATPQSPPAPAVAPKSVLVALGGVLSTSSGSIRGVSGRVGADVVGVVFDTVAKGPVTATVREGHVAVWWPDAPTTESRENAATAPEIRGATLTLRDGSTRQVTVEELTGRTTQELNRPASGGSATE
ncbi:hypothetical protein Skr01_74690 [Sphaerisporangium krabiense]|uniref:Uncharacterized protein n=1 Tax=Sphaerisporangium krabiense TaxID=763782 RepID=A0A7W8Z4B2_9ACTN|nr:hypothetical protein [Sphaerisporangium krabiense]MBB5626818.1 hypothetical protein [Sphaerisporangium krabiense]GII67384.1 hypothetical protein Skr01_74690 [Sphaerisporangium krabiense]